MVNNIYIAIDILQPKMNTCLFQEQQKKRSWEIAGMQDRQTDRQTKRPYIHLCAPKVWQPASMRARCGC